MPRSRIGCRLVSGCDVSAAAIIRAAGGGTSPHRQRGEPTSDDDRKNDGTRIPEQWVW